MMPQDIESTPLLGNLVNNNDNSGKTLTWKKFRDMIIRYKLHIYIPIGIISSFIIGFIMIFFIHVKPNLGVGVAEGTYFDTDKINMLGIGDSGGIDLKITGTNTNNFTNIDDFWIRNYFKDGGFFLRRLNLKIDELDLIIWDSSEEKDMNMGKVEIQPFLVRVVDGKSTDMELFVRLWPNSKGVRGLLKKLLLNPGSKLRLRGDANVKVYMLNGFLPVSSISIPLDIEF